MHEHSFLLNIAVALAAGLVGGAVARALRLPVIIGYLAAGIVIGPYTPGVFADSDAVRPVANLGAILLMFAVGVQFSLQELRAVGRTAIIGGALQISATIALGILVGLALGWSFYGGIFLGCAIALSSTAIMMRILEERGEVGTSHGAVMLGISVVQDLSLVLMVALLPAIAPHAVDGTGGLWNVALAVARSAAFIGATLLLATRGVPLVLDRVARSGSRELFVLTIVVICLAAAVCAEASGLGLALGAFMAGLVLSESDYAHEILSQVRPLRDIFASLFFVSIGMLLNPRFLIDHWQAVALVVAAIVAGKAILSSLAIYLSGGQARTAVLAGIGLAQIGEFSFVLATMGSQRGLIQDEIASVILSAALVTILLSPFLFQLGEPLFSLLNRNPRLSRALNRHIESGQVDHVGTGQSIQALVLGYGRVGRRVSDALRAEGVSHLVVEHDAQAVERCRQANVPVIYGDASSPTVLERAAPQDAALAIVALPDAVVTESAVRTLKALSPALPVIARVHKSAFIPRLKSVGAESVIYAEFEAAMEMIRQGLHSLGLSQSEVESFIESERRQWCRHVEE